jgi:hypothetical protein
MTRSETIRLLRQRLPEAPIAISLEQAMNEMDLTGQDCAIIDVEGC